MKTTIVPAQITTVEDKIAGNLSFTQLLLLVTPVFIDGAVFILLPPIFKFSFLKLMTCIVIALLCMTLAVRIKGKILLTWIAVIARYKLRPQYYLFNKNDTYLRIQETKVEQEPIREASVKEIEKLVAPFISTPEMVRLETAVHDPRANFHFKAGKGKLRVHIREIKKESI